MTATLIAPVRAPPVSAAPRKAVYEIRALAKVYHMGEVEVPALRLVNLDLYAGELVILLGASGSGKSTVLNTLGGLDTPTSGSVRSRDETSRQPTVGRSRISGGGVLASSFSSTTSSPA